MPKERMSACDKIINSLLFESKDFFSGNNHKHLIAILSDISEAMNHFKKRAEQMNQTLDADNHRKLITKCLCESPNRYIYNILRAILIKQEQSRVVQPQLLANP
jgi:hypothetical protein